MIPVVKKLRRSYIVLTSISIFVHHKLPKFTWGMQLYNAVSWMHQEGWIHRDLKPENILIKDEILLLCDFGTTVRKDECLPNGWKRTTHWYRPNQKISNSKPESGDWWAVACILQFMVNNGYSLFSCNDDKELSYLHQSFHYFPDGMLLGNYIWDEDEFTIIFDTFTKDFGNDGIAGDLHIDEQGNSQYEVGETIYQSLKDKRPIVQKKIAKAPKVVKSGVASSNVSSGREQIRSKIGKVRKSGNIQDAQSAILDIINLKSQQRK